MKLTTTQDLFDEALTRWSHTVDPARLERARLIAESRTSIYNNHCPAGQYDVRSDHGRGWYRVDTKAHTCTCMDSQQGHICKHRLAVWMYTTLRNRQAEDIR